MSLAPNQPRSIRAVAFDLFDTLVDLHMENLPRRDFRGRAIPATAGDLHRVVAQRAEVDFERFVDALVFVDEKLARPRYAEGRELPTRERFAALVEHLGVDDPKLPELLTDLHMESLREQVRSLDYHVAILDSLADSLPLALCSNFSHTPMALRVLGEAGLGGCFQSIAISEDVGVRKPRAEIFEKVLSDLDLEPQEVLHVGDNLRADVAGAARMGMATAWVTRRVSDPEAARSAYEGPEPTWVIRDLSELLDILGIA